MEEKPYYPETYLRRVPRFIVEKERRIQQALEKIAHYEAQPESMSRKRCLTLWQGRLRYACKELAELQKILKSS